MIVLSFNYWKISECLFLGLLSILYYNHKAPTNQVYDTALYTLLVQLLSHGRPWFPRLLQPQHHHHFFLRGRLDHPVLSPRRLGIPRRRRRQFSSPHWLHRPSRRRRFDPRSNHTPRLRLKWPWRREGPPPGAPTHGGGGGPHHRHREPPPGSSDIDSAQRVGVSHPRHQHRKTRGAL